MKKDGNGNYIEHSTRGYEVTGDYFYVDDIVHLYIEGEPVLDDGNPRLQHNKRIFQKFDEYYSYVTDIYTQGCYLGWFPNAEIIDKYRIDESKLNRCSLSTNSLNDNVWTLSKVAGKIAETIASKRKKEKYRKEFLKKMLKRLYECNEPLEIKKVFEQFDKKQFYGKDLKIILSVYFETKENAERLFLDSVKQNAIPDSFIEYVLACCQKPMLLAEQYEPFGYHVNTIRKYKKRAKSAARLFENFESHTKKTNAYYDSAGFFVIETTAFVNDGQKYSKLKVFEDFCAFANVLNNDLSGIDLSECMLEKVDFTQYKTDKKTILPFSKKNPLTYHLKKTYYNDTYFVTCAWKDEHGVVRYSDEFCFEHFADYLHFIGGKLDGSDFSLMPSEIYNRIRNAGVDISGVIAPETYNGSNDISEFDKTAQNEENSASVLQLIRPKEGKLIDSTFTNPHYEYNGTQILYLSDLHLDHILANSNCKTLSDVYPVLNRIGNELDKSFNEYSSFLGENIIVLINGDITHSPHIFRLFFSMDFCFIKRAFIILGNHELWAFPGLNVKDIVSKYQELCPTWVAHNEIVLFEDAIHDANSAYQQDYIRYKTKKISYDKAMTASYEELSNQMSSARMIMLVGIGFSGCNQEFNANNGIYRATLTRKQEIAESKKFDALYNRFIAATRFVKDRILVVATHMPLKDWHPNSIYEDGIIYINGHTHRNYFHDDGVRRIYADNQSGYHGKHPSFKCIYPDDIYDPFASYTDGIYEISKFDYILFYRAKKMHMSLNRNYKTIYMLKKNGYYCFLAKLASEKLSILNGGKANNLNVKDPKFYYDKMDEVIAQLSTPLAQYESIQKKVSDTVKSFGGSGKIHGCIVDIDFYNHIYINPVDFTVTGYYALDMVLKWTYVSIPAMLEEHSPDLFKNYKRMLKSNPKFTLVPTEASHPLSNQNGISYFETDIYNASREISKMQRLNNNVLSFWNDGLLNNECQNLKLPQIERK